MKVFLADISIFVAEGDGHGAFRASCGFNLISMNLWHFNAAIAILHHLAMFNFSGRSED